MNDNLTPYIKKCKMGDRDAFRQIVARYRQMVYTLSFRLLCNEEDAEDATQESFIKAWESIKRYDESFKFSTWLYKITANTCYDRLRRRKREKFVEIGGFELHDSSNIEEAIENRELGLLISKLTNGLSAKQRIVFILSDIEGLESTEIGEITGLSSGKIKSNLHLARKQIRKRVEGYEN